MKESNIFYDYWENDDKIKIFSDDIYNFFESKYDIIIDSTDLNQYQNVILYIEDLRIKMTPSELEKNLLEEIEHLNDVEVRKTKIILIFDCKEIELC